MGENGLTSAWGILALLQEPDVQLREHALEKLVTMVDEFWAEIAESLGLMCVILVPTPYNQVLTFPQRSSV